MFHYLYDLVILKMVDCREPSLPCVFQPMDVFWHPAELIKKSSYGIWLTVTYWLTCLVTRWQYPVWPSVETELFSPRLPWTVPSNCGISSGWRMNLLWRMSTFRDTIQTSSSGVTPLNRSAWLVTRPKPLLSCHCISRGGICYSLPACLKANVNHHPQPLHSIHTI